MPRLERKSVTHETVHSVQELSRYQPLANLSSLLKRKDWNCQLYVGEAPSRRRRGTSEPRPGRTTRAMPTH